MKKNKLKYFIYDFITFIIIIIMMLIIFFGLKNEIAYSNEKLDAIIGTLNGWGLDE